MSAVVLAGGSAHALAPSTLTTAASATKPAVRVAPPTTTSPPATTTPGGSGHFGTLPPGSALPDDATCAGRVRDVAELRPDNATANTTRGTAANATFPRVTGNFTGSTDELIQWAACKWGIDEDIVRAQIAKESAWHQSAKGDLTTTLSSCLPLVLTGAATCPESLGLGQVRYLYHGTAFAEDQRSGGAGAYRSSAYNLDYTYAVWRSCYEGNETWLNTVERGSSYGAGDVWGCLGVWYSGRWHTAAAEGYISAVQQYLADRVWAQPDFVNW